MPPADEKSQQQPSENKPAPPDAFGRGDGPGKDAGEKGKPDPQAKEKGDKPPDKKPFWKRPVLLSVMIAVAVLAIIAGSIYIVHARDFISTDDAFIDGRIAHIAPRVSGKVLALKVTDNQIVTADQVLLEIDPVPFDVKLRQVTAAQGQAEAQLEQAKANLQVARANAEQSDADVVVASANSLNAKQDFERFNKLQPQARSQQQLDLATANQRSTDAQVTAAQKKADSMHAQSKAGEKTVDAAEASLQAAKAQVEQAQLDLSYTKVVAGHSGRVTRRTVEVGNFVSIGQEMLDIVPTDVPDDIWVTANFKETQLVHMQPNQPVTITVDAFPDELLRGHIDSIQNGTGAVFSLLPPENATGNFVKVVQRVPVKIILDEQPRRMLSPGMSVEPEVDVRERR